MLVHLNIVILSAYIGRKFRTRWLNVNILVNTRLRQKILEYGNKSTYFFKYEQIILQVDGSNKYKNIPSISRPIMKWLNVVFDLNGILCVCLKERLMPRGQMSVVDKKPYLGTVPFLVGPKAVYICLL